MQSPQAIVWTIKTFRVLDYSVDNHSLRNDVPYINKIVEIGELCQITKFKFTNKFHAQIWNFLNITVLTHVTLFKLAMFKYARRMF